MIYYVKDYIEKYPKKLLKQIHLTQKNNKY